MEERLGQNMPLLRLWEVLGFIGVYLLFATKLGPRLMAGRTPFRLKWAMVAYNFAMVAVNAYFHFSIYGWIDWGRKFLDYVYPDKNDWSPATLSYLKMLYLYYLTKYADWFDTVFFVLRKKQSHVSVLHLYHHSLVPFLGWYAVSRGKKNFVKNIINKIK